MPGIKRGSSVLNGIMDSAYTKMNLTMRGTLLIENVHGMVLSSCLAGSMDPCDGDPEHPASNIAPDRYRDSEILVSLPRY